MADIVDILRLPICGYYGEDDTYSEGPQPDEMRLRAADEIERLRAEVEVLTKALRMVCDDISDFQVNDQMTFDEHISQVMNEYIEEARRG